MNTASSKIQPTGGIGRAGGVSTRTAAAPPRCSHTYFGYFFDFVPRGVPDNFLLNELTNSSWKENLGKALKTWKDSTGKA
jgi:hypothetical protein